MPEISSSYTYTDFLNDPFWLHSGIPNIESPGPLIQTIQTLHNVSSPLNLKSTPHHKIIYPRRRFLVPNDDGKEILCDIQREVIQRWRAKTALRIPESGLIGDDFEEKTSLLEGKQIYVPPTYNLTDLQLSEGKTEMLNAGYVDINIENNNEDVGSKGTLSRTCSPSGSSTPEVTNDTKVRPSRGIDFMRSSSPERSRPGLEMVENTIPNQSYNDVNVFLAQSNLPEVKKDNSTGRDPATGRYALRDLFPKGIGLDDLSRSPENQTESQKQNGRNRHESKPLELQRDGEPMGEIWIQWESGSKPLYVCFDSDTVQGSEGTSFFQWLMQCGGDEDARVENHNEVGEVDQIDREDSNLLMGGLETIEDEGTELDGEEEDDLESIDVYSEVDMEALSSMRRYGGENMSWADMVEDDDCDGDGIRIGREDMIGDRDEDGDIEEDSVESGCMLKNTFPHSFTRCDYEENEGIMDWGGNESGHDYDDGEEEEEDRTDWRD